MTLSLQVASHPGKRCDSSRRGLGTRASDWNHLGLALQSTVGFFLYCPVFTFLIIFAYTDIQLGRRFIDTAPGGGRRILCGGRE